MPELPEVETIRRDLSNLIVGKKIAAVATTSPKQIKPSLKTVKKAVVGVKIKKIDRRAKLLLLYLDNKKILLVHLKLTGRLLFRHKNDPSDEWVRVVISLSGGGELRFCDLRKFGWIKLVRARGLRAETEKFGREPFGKGFTVEYLEEVFSKTSRPVKLVLMDQEKIAGVGNIYANEALFLAGIDPRQPAKNLKIEKLKNLRSSVLKVLKAGIKYRGASDQYYLDALGHKGQYQEHFLVYQRAGQPCFRCGGKIKRIKIGGRGTFFCPHCQS